MICPNVTRIGVNIRDVTCIIEGKISDNLVFAILLQQIGKVGREKTLLVIYIVFIESKYVFLDNITNTRNCKYCEYKTTFGHNNSMQVIKITSSFYKNNI